MACPVCGVDNVEDLTAHVRAEHKVDGVVCPHCGKILSKTCTLNRHIEQVHLNLQVRTRLVRKKKNIKLDSSTYVLADPQEGDLRAVRQGLL